MYKSDKREHACTAAFLEFKERCVAHSGTCCPTQHRLPSVGPSCCCCLTQMGRPPPGRPRPLCPHPQGWSQQPAGTHHHHHQLASHHAQPREHGHHSAVRPTVGCDAVILLSSSLWWDLVVLLELALGLKLIPRCYPQIVSPFPPLCPSLTDSTMSLSATTTSFPYSASCTPDRVVWH